MNTGIRRLGRRRPEIPPDAVVVTTGAPASPSRTQSA
jgi:putative heme transporter